MSSDVIVAAVEPWPKLFAHYDAATLARRSQSPSRRPVTASEWAPVLIASCVRLVTLDGDGFAVDLGEHLGVGRSVRYDSNLVVPFGLTVAARPGDREAEDGRRPPRTEKELIIALFGSAAGVEGHAYALARRLRAERRSGDDVSALPGGSAPLVSASAPGKSAAPSLAGAAAGYGDLAEVAPTYAALPEHLARYGGNTTDRTEDR
ncbi:MAG: hypothetical protein JST53_00915 [Actinobacteria bacterium]|nr:hypothetical protein [Actinomycetota bacterium]